MDPPCVLCRRIPEVDLGLISGPKASTVDGSALTQSLFSEFHHSEAVEVSCSLLAVSPPGFRGCHVSLRMGDHGVPVCAPAGQRVLITEDLEDVEVREGSSATFCCRISPADYGPVHWFLDKTPLQANELNDIEAQPGGYHVLTLRQLTLKDSGTVHFEAGDQRASAALRITGRLCA